MNAPFQVTVAAPDETALVKAANAALHFSAGLVIESPEEMQMIAGELQGIKKRVKDLEELRTSLVGPFNDAVKNLNNIFRKPKEIYDTAEANFKGAILAFNRIQEEARQKAEREAQATAAKERAKLQAEAAEKRAKAEAEEKRLLEEAAAAAAAGDAAKAAKLESQAESKAETLSAQAADLQQQANNVAIMVPAADAQTKAKGISTREVWTYEITNREAIPLEYYTLDEKRIAQVVKSMKGHTNIPGIRAYPEQALSARAL